MTHQHRSGPQGSWEQSRQQYSAPQQNPHRRPSTPVGAREPQSVRGASQPQPFPWQPSQPPSPAVPAGGCGDGSGASALRPAGSAPPLPDSPVRRARLRPVTESSPSWAKAITPIVYRDPFVLGRSSVNRTLPGAAGDVALLLARLILGTIMFAHGYQKLFINGLGRTTQGFENMSIPVAIVSAAYVTVVELVGSVLVLAGALIPVVAACYLVVMVGAAVFVHIPNGVFAADNGWELVGAIAALLLVLAAAGPGRWSLVGTRRGSVPALEPAPSSAPTSAPVSQPPGLWDDSPPPPRQ
jgi:putative oxidoreductase